MNKLLTHTEIQRKEKHAVFSDFLAIRFPQNPVHAQVYSLSIATGEFTHFQCVHMARYASLIGAVLKHRRVTTYQIAQRLLARIVCGWYGTEVHSRQYANRIERYLERAGLISIPKYRTNVDSPPKVRTALPRFLEILGLDKASIRATDSCTTSRQVRRGGHAKGAGSPIFNCNPLREGVKRLIEPVVARLARPARATIFDSNHRKALEKRGIYQKQLSRCDRQLVFHCQRSIPDAMKALEVFVDLTRRRADAEPRALAFFERWRGLGAGKRTDAVSAWCGQDYLRSLTGRGLGEQERQFLYYCQATHKDLYESICFFVDIARLRRDGDELCHKFFTNWDDLTKWSKPGQVRQFKASLDLGRDERELQGTSQQALQQKALQQKALQPKALQPKAPAEAALLERLSGIKTILDGLAGTMPAREHIALSNSYWFNEPYQGCHADILQRLRDMSTLDDG